MAGERQSIRESHLLRTCPAYYFLVSRPFQDIQGELAYENVEKRHTESARSRKAGGLWFLSSEEGLLSVGELVFSVVFILAKMLV